MSIKNDTPEKYTFIKTSYQTIESHYAAHITEYKR